MSAPTDRPDAVVARRTVLYDRQCAFCMWTVVTLLRLDVRRRFATAPTQDSLALLPDLDERTALGSFHLVEPDGAVHSAGQALARLLRSLPATAVFGALLTVLPRGVSERVYRAVADRRATLARLLPEPAKARARDALLGADAPTPVAEPPTPIAPVTGPVATALVDPPAPAAADRPHDEVTGTAQASTRTEPAASTSEKERDAAKAPSGRGVRAEDVGLRASLRLVADHLRHNRIALVVGLVLLVISAVVGLAQPLATQWVLEALGTAHSLQGPVLVLVASVVGAALAQGGGQFLMLRVAEDVVLGTRRAMIRRVLGLSVGEMHGREPGELMSRVISDSASVRQVALQSVVQAVSGTVVVIGSVAMMLYLDWVLFLVTFGVVVVLCASLIAVMPRIRRSSHRTQRNLGGLSSELERALGTFPTVKAANAEQAEEDRIGDRATDARDSGVRAAWWTALAGMTSALTVQAAFLVVLGVGGLRAQSGELSVPTLVAFLLYAMQLSQPVLQLTAAVSSLQSGRAALERIAETESFEQEAEFVAPGIEPQAVPGGAAGDKGPLTAGDAAAPAVEFERVEFAYPEASEPTLRGVDLAVPGSGLTALVGPSGSGKSTLLRLIVGFYAVQGGRIRVAGRVLGDWDLERLRDHVAYVEQETPVLAGTVGSNLTYGREPGAVEQRSIWRVLERVGLTRRVHSLDLPVRHRGNDLSGGERQRMSIARALLRRPSLLLLDEVTSQLDTRTEAEIRQLIGEVAERIPVIAVAHRLSTVVGADLIVLMQDGRVRATGTHDELLASDELYRTMVADQGLARPAPVRAGR
ncbi:ABC transporter transmembrane domain-containing protein [Jatrophihabitans fulvus]